MFTNNLSLVLLSLFCSSLKGFIKVISSYFDQGGVLCPLNDDDFSLHVCASAYKCT